MEREGSNHIIPDFENLRLEKGGDLDVEDLDDNGWRAASEQKKIKEIGSLGEGAGGAVTRCRLEGGKTEFALKVYLFPIQWEWPCSRVARLLPPIRTQMSRSKLFENWLSTRIALLNISASTMEHLWTTQVGQSRSLWSTVKAEASTAYTEKSKSLVVELARRSWVK
jgi:mitogen-activated protein kinase kinase